MVSTKYMEGKDVIEQSRYLPPPGFVPPSLDEAVPPEGGTFSGLGLFGVSVLDAGLVFVGAIVLDCDIVFGGTGLGTGSVVGGVTSLDAEPDLDVTSVDSEPVIEGVTSLLFVWVRLVYVGVFFWFGTPWSTLFVGDIANNTRRLS